MTHATALLFPGQGSQESGMGRDLAESRKDIMEIWKKGERISGLPLREIYWEGDAEAMADTRSLQPALTVANIALWHAVSDKLSPLCAAGHSLGEYSAFAAASVLAVDAVLELVSLRGRLMADADPSGKGAMAALLKLSREDAEAAVAEAKEASGEMLLIANYNTPAQFVASGTKSAIEAVQESARSRKGRAVPLAVSGAFHSPLMDEAAKELGIALSKVSWSKARFPVFCNVTGQAATEADELKALALRQMTSSVLWIDTIRAQYQAGARRFVECGPKNVLSKMVSPILGTEAEGVEIVSVNSAEAAESFAR
ncbi:ACP S-malonyltransferase [Desulfovibrio sp. OttesenSCG-928-I05]|nr:ACP S-malonyltransferase [Desulfovibrio sp. OttesenSCG-928-I05]